jgi:starch-binding outer membrane protein, SusD/RagB family
MKLRWRILYILLGSLFLLPSCTDEDLDTTMYGGREDTEFYNNLEEINQALTACYFYMKDSWNDEPNNIYSILHLSFITVIV